jgi:ADP-ribose pyrophosphatase
MNGWKTLESKEVLTMGKWLRVEDRTVETPAGQVIPGWAWVTTPDYVNVLAVTPEGQYLVFRQGKYGLAGESFAPVGGYMEPGEEPLAAAQRELREETGYAAAEWIPLGTYRVDPNRGVCTGTLFLARGAVPVCAPSADDLEDLHLLLLSRAEVVAALRAGHFQVLAWTANIAMALLYEPAG